MSPRRCAGRAGRPAYGPCPRRAVRSQDIHTRGGSRRGDWGTRHDVVGREGEPPVITVALLLLPVLSLVLYGLDQVEDRWVLRRPAARRPRHRRRTRAGRR